MPEGKRSVVAALSLVKGDVTLQDVDAFVFYATHELKLGSGFGGAVAVRGGPTIQAELDALGPLETCGVAVTDAGELAARRIIHAVGPRFREQDLETKLRTTMRNVLGAASKEGLRSIAFPAMGAGFYGVPLDLCARVMVDEIQQHLEGSTSLEQVTVCVVDGRELAPFKACLGEE